ncbi:MAG: hypothetical protein DMG31_18895 [Acidobacteria bacterium]|nr:MAG: hypothetical protein DMG31_18895 [Acidobacteriota bacterium]
MRRENQEEPTFQTAKGGAPAEAWTSAGGLSYKSWVADEIRGDGELIFLSHRCAADHNIGGRNALQEGRDSAKLGVLIRNL